MEFGAHINARKPCLFPVPISEPIQCLSTCHQSFPSECALARERALSTCVSSITLLLVGLTSLALSESSSLDFMQFTVKGTAENP